MKKSRVGGWMQSVGDHLQQLVNREVAAGDAFEAIATDTRKLWHSVRKTGGSHEHRKAVRKVKEGVQAYNSACFDDAEKLFRKALYYDDHYARAHYFLANTCYKLGRLTEAVTHWNKAIESDPFSDVTEQATAKLSRLGKGDGDILVNIQDHMRSR
jgi:tetratricopeptide (TPR) repeat protein